MRRGTRGVFVAGVNAVVGMFTRDPASLGSEIVQLRVAYYTATLVEVLVREAAVQRTRRRLCVEVLMVVLRQVGARPAALGVATAYSIVVILVKAVQSARCMDVVNAKDMLAEVPEGLVQAFLEECVLVRPSPVPWGVGGEPQVGWCGGALKRVRGGLQVQRLRSGRRRLGR